MMKITKMVVTDEDGNEHTWEGHGFAHLRSRSKKGEPYVQVADAALTLPPVDEPKA